MSHFQSGKVSPIAHGDRYLTAAASLLVGGAFFGLWFWLLPQWLGFRADLAGAAHWHWLAALPSVLGFAVAIRCVWDFGWTGRSAQQIRGRLRRVLQECRSMVAARPGVGQATIAIEFTTSQCSPVSATQG
jgi:hypothetical protein